ncbi:MAG: endolytic transglycosylase MltG, partial [Alphaproteobacteria bacterium]|nr:endolytic transglycosylase MltG [Alphaproteobacteria bacterium]
MKLLTKKLWKKIKAWTKFILAIGCVFVFVVFYVFDVWSPIKREVNVVVPNGASVTRMANYLYKNNIIKSKELFYFSIRLNGGMIQAGEYDIPRGAGTWTIANMLTHGKIATTTVTIPEGYTVKQIKAMLMNIPYLVGEVDCQGPLPVCDLHDGDIFPDTYRIARGTSRLALLDLARNKMETIKKSFENARLPVPLKDWKVVLTFSSIVQKETPR